MYFEQNTISSPSQQSSSIESSLASGSSSQFNTTAEALSKAGLLSRLTSLETTVQKLKSDLEIERITRQGLERKANYLQAILKRDSVIREDEAGLVEGKKGPNSPEEENDEDWFIVKVASDPGSEGA